MLGPASAHFYGAGFYALSVWFDLCEERLKTKFKSLHYKILRSACKDYNFNMTKESMNRNAKGQPHLNGLDLLQQQKS